jgi:phosphosulfolactate synthase (CoM biosynthesis protein A)
LNSLTSRKFLQYTAIVQSKKHAESTFPFLANPSARESKPRNTGQTEIRGPYYGPMGKRYLSDILETMGSYVDSLKFAGGTFTLYPESGLVEVKKI